MALFPSIVIILFFAFAVAQAQNQNLALLDRFAIYEQLSLHQTLIDTDQTCTNAHAYADLDWPEGGFRVIDPNRDSIVTGLVHSFHLSKGFSVIVPRLILELFLCVLKDVEKGGKGRVIRNVGS